MPVLIVEKGPDRGRNILCSQSSPIVIGRGAKTTFRLNDPSVSREHFRIYKKDDSYCIEDAGSLNGTIVNGRTIEGACLLAEGTQINIGETGFTWSEMGEADKDPLIGRKLAGYHIKKRLGRGGMGTVYLARQLSLQRDVAIKVLEPKFGKDSTFIQQFIEEARASATLNHPNILQVYDVGGKDGHYYFSMEYAENGSIQRLIEGQKKLPAKVAIAYMLDTAKGLEYAERKKIVHRDIKPDNLMLSEDDIVKIGDLGLAKRLDRDDGKQEQGIYGTPHFISPEQARGEAVDYRADMYSFGASYYRILSGRTPFQGKNVQQIIMKHVMEELTPLRSLEPSLPNELCKIITKMMQKEKNKRYANNGELIVELEKVKKILDRGEKKIKAVQEIKVGRQTKKSEKNVTCRIGAEKKTRQGGSRRRKKASNGIYYAIATMAIVILGIMLAMALIPSSQKKRGKKYREKSEVFEDFSSENNRPEHGKKDTPLEQRYNELKRSQFTAADPTPFILGFQELAKKDPDGEVGNKALDELQRLLDEKVIFPCKELQDRKKFYPALQRLAKFEKTFSLPRLRRQLIDCRERLENAYSEELTYLEADFYEYEKNGQYHRIDENLKRLARSREVSSEDLNFILNHIIDNWSAKIKTHITGQPENPLEEPPDDHTPELPKQEPTSEVDGKLLKEYRDILDRALMSFKYKRGVKELEAALAGWDRKKYPRQWNKTPKELKRLDGLFRKLGENIKFGSYPVLDSALQKKFTTEISSLKPLCIEREKLMVRVIPSSGGSYKKGFPLEKLGPLWLYKNLMVGHGYNPRHLFNIALFCYHYRLYRQSWKFCRKASEAKAKLKLVRDLKARLKQVENKARNLYENEIDEEYQDLRQRRQELADLLDKGQDISGAKKEFAQNVKRFEKKLEQYREQYRYTRYFSKIEK